MNLKNKLWDCFDSRGSLLNISTDFIANLVTYTLSGNNEVRPPIALQCVKYMV